MIDHLLDVLAGAFPGGRGRGRRRPRAFDPALWQGPGVSVGSVIAAVAVFAPVVPFGVAAVRLAVAAFRLADDPMLFLFGLLLAIPAAIFALALFGASVAGALWMAAALLGGRRYADVYVGAHAVLWAGLAFFFLTVGLDVYGWWLLAGAGVTALALAARRLATA